MAPTAWSPIRDLFSRSANFLSSNLSILFRGVVSVLFRALSPNGVLLYAADDVNKPTHFFSLELVNGELLYQFNAGGGLVRVRSNYNNYSSGGHWWTVIFLYFIFLFFLPGL